MATKRQDRGELYVLAQAFLLIALFFGPSHLFGLPAAMSHSLWVAGKALFYIGLGIALWGAILLGPNLTPMPRPKSNGQLIQNGLYRHVRHPIYLGVILLSFGWAASEQNLYTLIVAILLLIFFDLKSRKEEEWLREQFKDYAEYQQKTKKLIPFIY